MADKITFSFGKNWYKFLESIDENAIKSALYDINRFIEPHEVKDKTVIDIGSGSGIHSLSFFRMQPRSLLSFDYDEFSVKATTKVREREGDPANWQVKQGSILDKDYVASLGKFDIVYSWGVLHHTGDMWNAISNASTLVKDGGLFFISIYQNVDEYDHDMKLKRRYNRSGYLGKKVMEGQWIWGLMKNRWKVRENPFGWNEKRERGMTTYHDIVDWLGGLPYEVASEQQINDFLVPRGFKILSEDLRPSCAVYLFKKERS